MVFRHFEPIQSGWLRSTRYRPKDSPVLKVQVKSRGAVDSGAFRIKSFDLDFVIFVRLNRGTKASRKAGQREGALTSPEFYIVPKDGIPPAWNDGA
jgi:hypothetical protein